MARLTCVTRFLWRDNPVGAVKASGGTHMKIRTAISVWSMATLCLIASFCAVPAFAQDHPTGTPHWSYSGPDGPEHWGDLDPSFAACKTGQHQSPIDIKGAAPADLKPIKFDYKLSPMTIVNNGHTILIKYQAGSSITVDGKQYPLVQFHFCLLYTSRCV